MRGTSNQELFPSLSSALSQSSLDDMNSEYEQLTKVNNDTTTKDIVQMYVGNLPEDFEVEVFQNIVDAFGGQSIGIKLVMDKRTQRTKGFGFVDFETIEAATLVMENMSQYEIDGQQLKVEIVEKEKKKNALPEENPLAVLARQTRERKVAEAKRQRELKEQQDEKRRARQQQLAEAMGG